MAATPTMPEPGEDPFALSHEVVEAVAALRPMTATYWGVAGHDDAWDDQSPEGHARVRATLAAFEARLPALRPPADRWARLAGDVLADYLRLELEHFASGDHLVDLNTIASPFQAFALVFDAMDASSEAAWQARAQRLETLGDALEGYRRTLELGLRTPRAVAARQIRAVIEQARVHEGPRSFAHAQPAAMDAAGVYAPALRARLEAAIPGACAAFGRFASWLEQGYLPHARATDAVGRARYVREARRFLGMEIDPEETYAWGWREVASIAEQMAALAARIAPGRSVVRVLELLKTDPSRAAPSAEAFIALMRARQHTALEQLTGTHFDVPAPVRTIEVKLAPPGGSLGAYYVAPTDGFARPGTVWYSRGDVATFPLFDEISTAYHEGFPGHHLQIGTQMALTDRLSRLHRVADGYTGYAEGWALYAEQLMAELGYFESPDYLFGMLACQMMRACRIVVDIGAHLELAIPTDQAFHPGERWSFETGVEMMTTLGGLQSAHAVSEMNRYLGWPAQAISYKVGQRVMLELRADEQRRLGAAFAPRAFHGRVLGCGNVGLDRLRALVRDDAAT